MFFGYYAKDMFIGMGTDFWGTSIYVLPQNYNKVDSEFIPTFFKLLPVFLSLLGCFIAFLLYSFNFYYIFKIVFLVFVFLCFF